MPIHERILNHEPLGESPDTQWFTARQPGIVRFLCERLQGDALALGLSASCRISLAFQGSTGRPAESVSSVWLARAEEQVCRRKHGQEDASQSGDDLPERHPALVAWIASLLDDPPVPLCRDEKRDVGMALLTVAHAFDRAMHS